MQYNTLKIIPSVFSEVYCTALDVSGYFPKKLGLN